MNILISGNVALLGVSLAQKLSKGKNDIVVTGDSASKDAFNFSNTSFFEVDFASEHYAEIFRSHKLDAVIFISADEDHYLKDSKVESSLSIVGLEKTLEHCRENGVQRVIYFTSIDVYGDIEQALEATKPEPTSVFSQMLLFGEELCDTFSREHGLKISIVRVPFVYGPGERNTLLRALVSRCTSDKSITLSFNKHSTCSFLHAGDVADFVDRLIIEEFRPEYRIFNLSAREMDYSFLAGLLKKQFPEVEWIFNDEEPEIKPSVEVRAAKQYFDWVAERDLITELPEYIQTVSLEEEERKPVLEKAKDFFEKNKTLVAWVEVLLGAMLMHLLITWTDTLIEFKYIDFRLLFVVIIGSVHGLQFGMLAAVLAAASGLYTWPQTFSATSLLKTSWGL